MLLRALVGVCVLACATEAQAARVLPHDECSTSPSFGTFYRHFKEVVARRDAKALIALIPAKHATMDFGGSDRKAFIANWKLDRGAKSSIWDKLSYVMKLGCARTAGGFISPYLFVHTPATRRESTDPGDTVISIGNQTLRAAPRDRSQAVRTLKWDVLYMDYDRPWPKGWRAVRDEAGTKGFIPVDAIYGGLDYRAAFTKANGRWALTFFGGGD